MTPDAPQKRRQHRHRMFSWRDWTDWRECDGKCAVSMASRATVWEHRDAPPDAQPDAGDVPTAFIKAMDCDETYSAEDLRGFWLGDYGDIWRAAIRSQPDAGEEIVHSALQAALDFFESRDEMNAFVHQGAVRWSPITEKVREAVAIIRRKP